MAVTLNDIVRVAFKQEYGGIDDVVNVMQFKVTTVPGLGGDALFLADVGELAGALWAELESNIPTGLKPVDIEVYNLTDDSPVGIASWSGYTGGGSSADAMPLADCLLIIAPTTVKRTQGRIYLSPWSEGSQADGIWGAGAQILAEAFYSILSTEFVGSQGYGLTYGVYSRSGGVLNLPTGFRVQPRTAYQLRRKPGRGS